MPKYDRFKKGSHPQVWWSRYLKDQVKQSLWIKYLSLSKTYRLAEKTVKRKKLTLDEKELVPDYFDLVVETYKNFGDVWGVNFKAWQEGNKKYQQEANIGSPTRVLAYLNNSDDVESAITSATKKLQEFAKNDWEYLGKDDYMIVAIPMRESSRYARGFVGSILNSQQKLVEEYPTTFKPNIEQHFIFKPDVNKFRVDNLNLLYSLVLLKAKNENFRTWHLAKTLNLCEDDVKSILAYESQDKALRNKTLAPIDEKMVVNAVIGRHFRNAFLLAENAAMGQFPTTNNKFQISLSNTKTYFDYSDIQKNCS